MLNSVKVKHTLEGWLVALLGPLRLDPFRTCVAKAIARRFNSTPIRLSSFPPSSPDIVDTNDNDDDGQQ